MVRETLQDRAEEEKRPAHLRLRGGVPSSGLGDTAYVHDKERELFRFHDGKFAFSREHANWVLLRKRDRIKGL
jgi:hypothetical protein